MKKGATKTKIVATLGPASFASRVLRRLLAAGVDGFRFNLSHGDFARHAEVIRRLRDLSAAAGRSAAIIVDLPGPKMRLGILPEPVQVRRGELVLFAPAGTASRREGVVLPHEIAGLAAGLRRGSLIHVNDGLLQFRVREVQGEAVLATALVAGTVRSNKGVNIPGYQPPAGVLTDRDRQGIAFAVEQRADVICISFVGGPEDLRAARSLLPSGREYVPCLPAKIERRQALRNLEGILAEADAVMVARGDLGIELPLAEIPVRQKEIVRRANMAAKPVIVATQMLLSMVENARPTRAEVTDVANAILDGADAIMFSEETAIGHDPAAVVRVARSIAARTERGPLRACGAGTELIRGRIRDSDSVDDLISSAAFDALESRSADLAVAPTTSGATARRIARLRPRPWIAAITDNRTVANILALSSGVRPLLVPDAALTDDALARLLQEQGLVRPGGRLIITAGTPFGVAGTTNSLRILDLC
jgi:pyruvate kinase